MAQVVISGHVAMATFFSTLYNTGEETNSDIFPLDFAVGKIQVRGCFYCPAVEIRVSVRLEMSCNAFILEMIF